MVGGGNHQRVFGQPARIQGVEDQSDPSSSTRAEALKAAMSCRVSGASESGPGGC